MLDLPGQPTIDKPGLIGTCSRLPVRVDAAQLQTEVLRGNAPATRVTNQDRAMRGGQ
jgi:hypothetical protein